MQPTSYSYNVLGNLVGVTQGVQTRTFTYDSLSRLRTVLNPEAGTTTYTYDDSGNMITRQDARPVTTTITYDGINRPTAKTYSDSTPRVDYFYDTQSLPTGAPTFDRGHAKGRLVAVTYGGGSAGTYRGYDGRGLVVRQQQQTDSVNYLAEATYRLNGSIETETYPLVPGAADRRTITYTHDNAGRLASLSAPATTYAPTASVSSISYTAPGTLSSETYGNSLVHAVTHNSRLQTSEIKLGTGGNPTSVVSIAYNYGTTNNNGNVQSITYAGGGLSYTQNFGYDSLNRLTTSNENGGTNWSQTNGYDRYGNRWIDLGGGNQSLYFTASNNRITGSSCDAAGNLLNDGTHSYAYDAENKITKVDNVNAYVYDGDGQRVRKLIGENRRFVYGISGELIMEFNGATGALTKEYIYGAGGLLATIEPSAVNSNGTRYTTADHLGSPRVVTNSSATVISRHDYMPFGEELGAGVGGRTTGMGFPGIADGLRQKFTSKERDVETGLDYFRARYYSSTHGRFTSIDPVAGSLSNPQSLNRYSYALNNPQKFNDPTGMTVDWADSTKTKEKGETEERTKAQRKYENQMAKLLASKDPKERQRGERLQKTYQRLKESKATFRVVREDSGSSSSGELNFDGKVFIVSLKGDTNAYGALDENQKLAHEFEHGRQVLDGELSFHNFHPPDWKPFALDRTDEAKAFAAGFDATPVALDQSEFMHGMRRATQAGGVKAGVDYLGRSKTKYQYLPKGPDNVNNRSPSIYAVPK